MDYETLLGGQDFKQPSIRAAFVRKVYSILSVQLAITTAIICAFTFNPEMHKFVLNNPAFFWSAHFVAFGLLVSLACFQDLRRSFPLNYIFLVLFTIVQSLTLSCVTVLFDAQQILYAVTITCVVCLGVTLFSFQTSVDFTVWGGFLCMAGLALFLFSLVVLFFPSQILVFLTGCLGAILFSLYLLYDTQLMLGGRHQVAISPEEYIFAALNLYVDILHVFLSILQIMWSSQQK